MMRIIIKLMAMREREHWNFLGISEWSPFGSSSQKATFGTTEYIIPLLLFIGGQINRHMCVLVCVLQTEPSPPPSNVEQVKQLSETNSSQRARANEEAPYGYGHMDGRTTSHRNIIFISSWDDNGLMIRKSPWFHSIIIMYEYVVLLLLLWNVHVPE